MKRPGSNFGPVQPEFPSTQSEKTSVDCHENRNLLGLPLLEDHFGVGKAGCMHDQEQTAPFRPPPLKIGPLVVDPPLVLAPMAGVTDSVYRWIMAEHGVGLVFTEMVSAQGLLRGNRESIRLCRQDLPLPGPLSVQIFGGDVDVVGRAAASLEALGASAVDINAGCPVRKVLRQGAGAGLLQKPDLLARMVEKVKRSVRIPTTVKIRLDWTQSYSATVNLAKRLESAGADAITLHGRTPAQQFRGDADWTAIEQVKKSLGIPLIGNGDITRPSQADRVLREGKCDGVMIGRGSLGNPWLFSTIVSRWRSPVQRNPHPGWEDFFRTVHDHVRAFREKWPHCMGRLRTLLMYYSKGFPDTCRLRARLSTADGWDVLLSAFDSWMEDIARRGWAFLPFKIPELKKGEEP